MTTPTIASATSATNAAQTSTTSTQQTATTGFGDNFNTFLKLLTTQLQNQDPLSPLDTNQFTQQLVSFSQVEQAINTNQKLSTLVSMASTSQAVSALPLVGKTVEYDGSSAVLAGGSAHFSYTLPNQATSSVITISNAQGQVVWRGAGDTGAGKHDFVWNGTDPTGATLPEGSYSISIAATGVDKSAITATTTGFGKVDGIELSSGQPLMTIGGLKVPTTKMLAVKDTI
jgi:flagellar basal-body rod modification protein FlgD